ncbi:hypothetical protein AHAS_Ahas19G0317100 [Arachis hypogaea]
MLHMEGINRKSSFGYNPFLEKLQRDLWKGYEEVVIQEEAYWQQMSRCSFPEILEQGVTMLGNNVTLE